MADKLKPIDHARAILKRGLCPHHDWKDAAVEPFRCSLSPNLKGDAPCTADDYRICPLCLK